jgi:hypothetical protein
MRMPLVRARYRRLVVAVGSCLPFLVPRPAAAQWQRQFTDLRPDPVRLSVALTSELATYTASHNEYMDGRFRTAAVQVAKPVVRVRGVSIAWLGEVSPVMLVRSAAPPTRLPASSDPALRDPAVMASYAPHNGYGVGLAPLGAEATRAIGGRTHLVLNVTSGGAWFNRVVPYGRATQANFTVAPGLLVERRIGTHQALSMGYVLHHLSNASMGGANPGMNSHLLTLRWTRGNQ